MKKEFAIRLKNSSRQCKPENWTKPSIKKPHPRPTKPLIHPRRRASAKPLSPPPQPPTTLHTHCLPSQHPVCQTPEETPPLMHLQHYITDIHNHIAERDRSFNCSLSLRLKAAGHIQITSEMRKILLRWLMKVCNKFHIHAQTMHICVQLIDYMLIHKGQILNKTNFQLLGVTCLFISCKYNEIYTIQSEKYVQFCDGIYTVDQLFEMQSFVLLEIDFNLQLPTVHQFVAKFAFQHKIIPQHMKFIRTLADISVFDFNIFNNFSKFQLATSIAYFTSKLYKLDSLKCDLAQYKNIIEPETFKSCFMGVVGLFKKNHHIPFNLYY